MRKKYPDAGMNMTPMIDVVFQLIIFFVTTADQQNKEADLKLKMAMAPNGVAVEKKDPRTITVDVDNKGRVFINRTPLTIGALKAILGNAVQRYGQTLPVVIRGDRRTQHEAIRSVMDACSFAGLWRVKFSAVKEKNTSD